MFRKNATLVTVLTVCLGTSAAEARVAYDPVLEWNGPYFRAGNAPTVDQLVDTPAVDIPFSSPNAIAAREHSSRDLVYVVDSGHNRVQAFEVNATYTYRTQADLSWTEPVTAAAQWDSDQIYLPEWAASATHFLVPQSEALWVNGVRWTRVADLSGFAASDHVYTIDDSDASNAPEIRLPANSLSSSSHLAVRYLISDEHTGASAAFGLGDVDYGVGAAATPVLVTLDESSGGPTSWQGVRSIAVAQNEVTSTTDDVFLLDTDDSSVGGSEFLFEFSVGDDGVVSYDEAYDDELATPYDVAIARSGASTAASAAVNNDLGPFDQATISIVDASQVTGHTYDVTVTLTVVSITDRTTGRLLVSSASFAHLANPCLAIPGVSLTLNGSAGVNQVITTTGAISNRYLFVADTGNDRIKVIAAGDGVGASWPGDWLPGDSHSPAAQPTGAGTVGQFQDTDYRYTTPATVPEDYTVFSNAAPIKETSLQTVTFDPGGTPDVWVATTDLSAASSSAKVFEVDWSSGRLLFGDGVHGRIPPAATQFQFSYSTSPDLLHYGELGTGSGRFHGPKGVAARWNASLGAYDLYVADTSNDRIVKLAFVPARSTQHLPARIDWVTSWTTASSSSDLLDTPTDVAVAQDGSGIVWLAVSDAGSSRVVIYRDTAATSGGGTTAPTFDNTLGSNADALGSYQALRGLAWLSNGSELDLYAADATRNVVTKYEAAPQASITLDFSGASSLPACIAPTGAYLFSFDTANAPEGGWVDFYYDTAATWSAATAHRCKPAHSTSATASQAVWAIDATPGGTPSDNDAYYLYAVLRDSSDVEVARDQTDADHLFCVDSSILPTVRIADAIDGDRTLYLQNGLERTVLLQVANPDSVVGAGWSATFDPDLIEVLDISPGNGWDGTGFSNRVFTSDFDDDEGTFTVSSSVTGAPVGLVTPGPHTLARVSLRAKASALSGSTRVRNGTLTLLTTGSGMNDVRNHAPSSWRASSLRLRLAYLGDLATDTSGADSTVPHLMPKPDGKINFADQVAFTAGWNGANLTQDRIADIGPAEGTAPDLVSAPDGVWDIEDILAFTTMYSWANPSQSARPEAAAQNERHQTLEAPRPRLLGAPSDGGSSPLIESSFDAIRAGAPFELAIGVQALTSLTGAQLILGFDPAALEVTSIEDGGFLRGADGGIFFHRVGPGWIEISSTRLDRREPGSHGSGVLARIGFRIRAIDSTPLSLQYDLRAPNGAILGRGEQTFEPFLKVDVPFALASPSPNPARDRSDLLFSVPTPGEARLELFDASGRRLRSLLQGVVEAGAHVITIERRENGETLPGGIYFLRLSAGTDRATRKLIWLR